MQLVLVPFTFKNFPVFSECDSFSKKKTTKDRKISLKDTVQNNYSWILKSVDACIVVEILPFVDL